MDMRGNLLITFLTAKTESMIAELESLKDEKLDLEFKKHREKRSLDANSYCWVLIGKIADVLTPKSKDEVYIEMLKRYGQREKQLISVVAEAVEIIFRATDNHCAEVGESELNGKLFKHLAILIGSSKYDSKMMSIFVDGIISECELLNIETATPEEIARYKSEWETKNK
jgi:hypothetical protein